MTHPSIASHVYAVILAGGRGERFWPLSVKSRPKQFISIFGGKPLISHAVDRLEGVVPAERVLIITSSDLIETTRSVANQLPPENVIGEPIGRDTAAAVALACGLVKQRDPKGIVAILTADQLMRDEVEFRQVLADAYWVASQEDAIVTMGITPTYPATGFGYIETGDALEVKTATGFTVAKRFVEKPSADKAVAYLETGRFLWNAGMFIWRIDVMEAAFKLGAPDIYPMIDAVALTPDVDAWMAEHYPTIRRISVDFAVMEQAPRIVVAQGDFGWDDVGTWPSIESHLPSDEQDNVIIGLCKAVASRSNIVITEGVDRFTALFGVDDLVVVQTPTTTMICPKARAQELKTLVSQVAELDQDWV